MRRIGIITYKSVDVYKRQTYNQLIKSKIEKLSSNLAETIANHQPETPRKKFSEQSNAFKEVFSEDTALQQEASFNSCLLYTSKRSPS